MTEEPLNDLGMHIAYVVPAKEDDVQAVLLAPMHANGRGEFKWITLANGDVLLGVYPQGDLFLRLLDKGAFE